jgi:UDP-N-acetylglucosamine:LPS N-acetylglucosamine transferase
MKKVLAVSSPGGHWIQLNKICDGLYHEHNIVYAVPVAHFKSGQNTHKKIYDILDVSADSKLRLIPSSLQMLFILLKEKPDVIISTGAAPGVVAIFLGKFLRKQTIWVDSIANVKKISRSGSMVKGKVDTFLTQWEHLSDGDTIKYQGAVL